MDESFTDLKKNSIANSHLHDDSGTITTYLDEISGLFYQVGYTKWITGKYTRQIL